MSEATETPVPPQLNVGDTIAAKYPEPEISELYKPDNDYSIAWKLLFENLDPAQTGVITLTGEVSNEYITFLSDDGLAAGSYRWRMIAELTGTRITGVRKLTALEGYIVVIQPEIKASFPRRMIPILEALYEDRVKGRGDVVSYMVSGRNYMAMSLHELRNEINFFKQAARQAEGKTAWKQWEPPFGG